MELVYGSVKEERGKKKKRLLMMMGLGGNRRIKIEWGFYWWGKCCPVLHLSTLLFLLLSGCRCLTSRTVEAVLGYLVYLTLQMEGGTA